MRLTIPCLTTLLAFSAHAAEPKQPNLDDVNAFCDAMLKPTEFADFGLKPYPNWSTAHKKGQRVKCDWSGSGRGTGMSVLDVEATCGKRKYDEAFCKNLKARFESGQKMVGPTAKGFFEEPIEGAVCHTLAVGLSGDSDFVYLDNGCYFVFNTVTVEREPKATKAERVKQAKLAIARKLAQRMR